LTISQPTQLAYYYIQFDDGQSNLSHQSLSSTREITIQYAYTTPGRKTIVVQQSDQPFATTGLSSPQYYTAMLNGSVPAITTLSLMVDTKSGQAIDYPWSLDAFEYIYTINYNTNNTNAFKSFGSGSVILTLEMADIYDRARTQYLSRSAYEKGESPVISLSNQTHEYNFSSTYSKAVNTTFHAHL